MKENRKIPKGWIEVQLGDILKLEYGKSLPSAERESGPYPVYGSNGIVDYHNDHLIQGSSIIVGRKGSVGTIHYPAKPRQLKSYIPISQREISDFPELPET